MIERFATPAAAAVLLAAPMAASATVLTDITVFSSNSEGNNWNGLIWNTQGSDTDVPNRYNVYVSQDPLSDTTPTFINHFDDSQARIALSLTSGDSTFSIYGEGVGVTFDLNPIALVLLQELGQPEQAREAVDQYLSLIHI